jgi:hypothetical protein
VLLYQPLFTFMVLLSAALIRAKEVIEFVGVFEIHNK